MTTMYIIIAVGVILLILIAGFISISNNIKRMKLSVDEAKADIEVYMVKRYDVIMNSLEAARKYIEHEEAIFSKLTKIRKGESLDKMEKQAQFQAQAQRQLFATAEAYPELKSVQLFTTLQKQLADENEHYAASKRMYNSNATTYNQTIAVFPNSIVASMTGAQTIPLFHDEDADNKRNADIKF